MMPMSTSIPPEKWAFTVHHQRILETKECLAGIAATLHKRAFNRNKVDAKNTVAVFQNLGGMQQEALQMSAEARRMAAEHNR